MASDFPGGLQAPLLSVSGPSSPVPLPRQRHNEIPTPAVALASSQSIIPIDPRHLPALSPRLQTRELFGTVASPSAPDASGVGAAARLVLYMPPPLPTQVLFWHRVQAGLLPGPRWLGVAGSELAHVTRFCRKGALGSALLGEARLLPSPVAPSAALLHSAQSSPPLSAPPSLTGCLRGTPPASAGCQPLRGV